MDMPTTIITISTAIVVALVAGVVAGSRDVAAQAVKDGYNALKGWIIRRPGSKTGMQQVEKKPDPDTRQTGCDAKLNGESAIANGSNAAAAVDGSIAVTGGVRKATLITGDSYVNLGPVAVTVEKGGTSIGTVIQIADPNGLCPVPDEKRLPEDLRPATEGYLSYLANRYQYLDFRGMGVSDRIPLRLPLTEMYVPLKARIEMPEGETWARELKVAGRKASGTEIESMGQRMSQPIAVLELLKQHPGLIILGDPGAGKTTFLKYLVLHLALGQEKELGIETRLPFLLPLSAYANALVERDVPLASFMAKYYQDMGISLPVDQMLEQAMEKGEALLLLDGLDEVKGLGQRHIVVNRVVDFFTLWQQKGNKFILTSRIVGYKEVRPAVPGLAECTLVDFENDDITLFIEKWTTAIEQAVRGKTPVAAEEAAQERKELLAAVQSNPSVRHLAANPLLLTILALMKRQGVNLPNRRVELYQNYVETLLKHWNLARSLGRPLSHDMDVVETMKVLAPLALWMHKTNPGVGLVKQEELRRQLEGIYAGRGAPEPDKAASQFLSDVRDHTGLLLERGAREYGFIHLTFQEYLTAIAIAQQGQQGIEPVARILAEHLGDDNWHEVSLLTIGYLGIIQQRDEAAGDVLLKLQGLSLNKPGQAAVLAGEAVMDAWPGGVPLKCRDTVIQALSQTIRDDDRVAPDWRAFAGRVLAKLSDPRQGVLSVEQMEFRDIPAGGFIMGSKDDPAADDNDCPRHTCNIPYDYRISRYPVTNAQFQLFVRAQGYQTGRYWSEAKDAGVWKNGRVKGWGDDSPRQGAYDCGEPFNLPNHPVVGVTWYEALAFTRWMTERLREEGMLAADCEIRLPGEAEWEKAARGTDGRTFPWGQVMDTNRVNYDGTGIGTTSAVGCFPAGVSPYGVEEMSGNVWEWTRSLWDKGRSEPEFGYPYNPVDGRERLEASSDVRRVLRGGGFDDGEYGVRCAARPRNDPNDWNGSIGFRVVASPFTSDL